MSEPTRNLWRRPEQMPRKPDPLVLLEQQAGSVQNENQMNEVRATVHTVMDDTSYLHVLTLESGHVVQRSHSQVIRLPSGLYQFKLLSLVHDWEDDYPVTLKHGGTQERLEDRDALAQRLGDILRAESTWRVIDALGLQAGNRPIAD